MRKKRSPPGSLVGDGDFLSSLYRVSVNDRADCTYVCRVGICGSYSLLREAYRGLPARLGEIRSVEGVDGGWRGDNSALEPTITVTPRETVSSTRTDTPKPRLHSFRSNGGRGEARALEDDLRTTMAEQNLYIFFVQQYTSSSNTSFFVKWRSSCKINGKRLNVMCTSDNRIRGERGETE